MNNIFEMKKLLPEVDDARAQTKVLIQKKQLEELRDTHGAQLERLSRNKEKLKALQMELRDRINYNKKLLERYNDENQNTHEENEGLEIRSKFDNLGKDENKKDELHQKIMEKLTMNLEKLSSHIDQKLKDEFKTKERVLNADEKDSYSKTYFVAVCVKYIKKIKIDPLSQNNKSQNLSKNLNLNDFFGENAEKVEEKHEEIFFSTFRISRITTFLNLKLVAGDLWGLQITVPNPLNLEKGRKESLIQNEKDNEDKENEKGNEDNLFIKDKEKVDINIEKEKEKEKGRLKDREDEKKYSLYELLDENYSEIPENKYHQSVETYFQQRGSEFTQALIILREKEQKEEQIEGDKKVQKEKGENQTYKLRNDEDLNEEFYKRFPGMKKYIRITVSKVKKKRTEGEGFLFNDNHFCIFFWIMIMLILNILTVMTNLNVFKTYMNNDNILMLLDALPNFKSKIPDVESTFYTITNSETFYQYLLTSVATQLFYDNNEDYDTQPKIYKSYAIAGDVILRQVRIKSVTCPMFTLPNVSCSYPYYTKDLRDENSADDTFETEQTTKISDTFGGEFGTYDGSGYMQRFNPYIETNDTNNYTETPRSIFSSRIFALNETYITSNTQALFLQFNLYNPNQDLWTYVFLAVEVCPTGTFFPYPAQLTHFKLDIYSSEFGPIIKVCDVLKGIICVFLLIFILYFVFCSRQMGEFNFAYITSFQGVCNCLIVIFSYISIYYSSNQSALTLTEKDLFTSTNYIDLSTYGYYYNKFFIYEAILVAILILRVFSVLKINKRFNILIKTIENAQTDIFNYSIILFPILLGFAALAQSIFGSNMVDYSNFERSFISILLLTIGQVDWTRMITAAPTITLPFLLIFYMIIVFFLLSLFLGIYIDNYRTVVLEFGFLYEKELSWTPKDYIKWMLHWMPKKCLRNLKLITFDENVKKYD